MSGIKTLGEFIIERQQDFSEATGELSNLLSSIRLAAKVVNREVNRAGLVDILGSYGSENIQGEVQQKLDVYANSRFIQALQARGMVAGVASEENDDFIAFEDTKSMNGKYVILMDPLDGSSNIDVNVSIGTIFSIYKRISPEGSRVTLADFLQPGRNQVAAGYVLYGSSSILVYTTGNGVNAFTLDPSIGTFCLSHPDIKMPKEGKIYSVNEGNLQSFSSGVKEYISYCQQEDTSSNRPYSSRYVGSLVADFHRNLLKGGIYIYPGTKKSPNGKLRLLYECNPLAFIAEQAGGKASNGIKNILDIQPQELHERVPFFAGSENMVKKAESYLTS